MAGLWPADAGSDAQPARADAQTAEAAAFAARGRPGLAVVSSLAQTQASGVGRRDLTVSHLHLQIDTRNGM
jgi:hypothetical protein